MSAQDALQIKDRIPIILRNRGPSLPVHIAKEIGLSILFTSAFLSELFNENEIKVSHMRVGSSPIYYLPGQEPSLENYAEYLKSKERESFLLLKERKFLKESELEPAIRVAIKEIKDFAIPFRLGEEVWWRYFTTDESELENQEKTIEESPTEVEKEIEESEEPTEEKELKIFDEEEKPKEIIQRKVPAKRAKPGEKFFEKVKEFLSRSSVEIMSIEGLKKEELVLKVRIHGEEQLLVAYNKKKISEKEILKASKISSDFNLKYSILSLGELPRKISNLIDALKNIKTIGKVE